MKKAKAAEISLEFVAEWARFTAASEESDVEVLSLSRKFQSPVANTT